MLSTSSVKQALNLNVAITPLMVDALQTWSAMYINQPSWKTGEIKTLNLPASIAAELARAVTIEMDVQISGSARADFLAKQMKKVVDNLRQYTEYCSAKGGLWFKPYIKGNEIAIDYVQADQGYPIAFDTNGNMTAAVFADQKTIGQYFYTRLEYHEMTPEGYQIKNMAYRSTTRDMLGTQIPLSTVDAWAELEPEATILNIDRPLFAYFKMPFANNIDPTSPLGVSAYARAVELIEQADILWTDLCWEFESGKRALYTDILAFGKDSNNKPLLPDKRLYRLLDLQGKLDGPGFFEDWTPTIRGQDYINGLENVYRLIEYHCGLAEGSLPRPAVLQFATATEIKMTKQRTYATITDTQKSLEDALENLLYAMDVWCTLGNLAPRGTYTTNYTFDDSIVSDYDSRFQQDSQELGLGTMSKIEFRMRNHGENEVTARKMLALIEPVASFFPAFSGAEAGGGAE